MEKAEEGNIKGEKDEVKKESKHENPLENVVFTKDNKEINDSVKEAITEEEEKEKCDEVNEKCDKEKLDNL